MINKQCKKPHALKYFILLLLAGFTTIHVTGQTSEEHNTNWLCKRADEVKINGEQLSKVSYKTVKWLKATVPGTVLTTLLNNKLVPDPFVGMNNEKIPDIYFTGRDYYTYWFINDFNEPALTNKEQVWLNFRGINYAYNIYLNGHKLNLTLQTGMFVRHSYNITGYLSKDGRNRLAVIVYPPDPVGNPNGGQGGDGTIGRNVSSQYVAGWDWIQPIRDRNTGIWDKVTIRETYPVKIKNPHVVTRVPGKRNPDTPQEPALITPSVELENPTEEAIQGNIVFAIGNMQVSKAVTLNPNSTMEVTMDEFTLLNPRLWWPNGYGEHYLYPAEFRFVAMDGKTCDKEDLKVGIREIQTRWNEITRSRNTFVNGQKIFIRGGDWVISDAMLRFSEKRYDAEVHFHHDMNLNLIRIWGGAIVERPEFYDACDKYGILVFQDFGVSGDCNGRWLDGMKKDDQFTRRNYPDDHRLFIRSVADMVKMIRNHPSLAYYCGGNEITPPEDIMKVMQDSIFPKLDDTRYLFHYSNSDSMSFNFLGGNGDGPYGIQNINTFWNHRSFPFNSEVGSVGISDYESLKRFIPKENLVVPDDSKRKVDSVWGYHKYQGYDTYMDAYGKPLDVKDYARKAQLINYEQYRALIEGFSSHMWDWYTGVIIWKTQNPWTALRGQMYDWYLDPNACLYGLHSAGEPLHVMYNPVNGTLMVINNTPRVYHDLFVQAKAFDFKGKEYLFSEIVTELNPVTIQKMDSIKVPLDNLRKEQGAFLSLRIMNMQKQVISDNLYWLPDSTGNYSGLQKMDAGRLKMTARRIASDAIEVKAANPSPGPLAFFNRISLVDKESKNRILPVFYSDNYFSVLPGEEKLITIQCDPEIKTDKMLISLEGWNVKEQLEEIDNK